MDNESELKEKYRGLLDKLDRIPGGLNVTLGEPMSLHATMRTGGPADIFLEPRSEEALIAAIEAIGSEDTPWLAVGNCSNIIVKDGGYRGAVISLTSALTGIEVSSLPDGAVIKVGAGEPLSKLASAAAEASLTGLEFAAGIPGSVGGAVYMNAGAYGGEIKDCLTEIRCYERDSGKTVVIRAEDARLGYRTSMFKDGGYIILEAIFALRCGVREEIDSKIKELFERRNARQPVELPSSGSFFKRPEGYYAGKLIEDAGMKGFASGAAEVSPKHAGFIVNNGGATTADVLAVADAVRKKVEADTGVTLEAEPIITGEDAGGDAGEGICEGAVEELS